MSEVTAPPGYGTGTVDTWRHGRLVVVPDRVVVALAAAVAVAVASRSPVTAALAAAAVATFARSRVVLAVGIVLALTGAVRSEQAWEGLAPDELGPYQGWVRIVDDPQPRGSSTRVILDIDGERFETWARGRARQLRVAHWRGGEWIHVHGERRELDASRAHRVAWQHVVGRFDLEWTSDVAPGSPLARASNRVRATIERAAATMPEPLGALYRGLVIGDDRDQPPDMIARFRASGMSHLTAVSGQNVSFVIAACGPLLVRLRPWARWAATVGLIFWFAALTRFEPSILRAGVMAALAATATTTGRERSPVRLLALAVIVLLLVDPLLAWSVGFWLSVGATAGVCTVGPWLAARLHGFGPLAVPLGVTLGAQAGVIVPSLLVFGRLPFVSVVANLAAVPVAGFVMLYGLPAGLVAGTVPATAPVVMLPARLGTRWVDTVAALGARLEPPPPWNWIAWAVLVVVVAACVRVRRR